MITKSINSLIEENAKSADNKFKSHLNYITQIKNKITEVTNKISILNSDIDNKIAEELAEQLMQVIGYIEIKNKIRWYMVWMLN